VTDDRALIDLVDAALSGFDSIDVLINNAGVIQGGDFVAAGPEAFRRQVEVNLLAPMRLTQLVVPEMKRQGCGWVVNVASVLGRHTMPFFTAYAASKRGLIGFSEGLRRELMGAGVYALTVEAGFASTGMVAGAESVLRRYGVWVMPPAYVADRILDAVPLRRRVLYLFRIEWLAVWIGALSPGLADLLWRLLAPPDLAEIAARQHTE
jgi:short-subunit dehydrogenase